MNAQGPDNAHVCVYQCSPQDTITAHTGRCESLPFLTEETGKTSSDIITFSPYLSVFLICKSDFRLCFVFIWEVFCFFSFVGFILALVCVQPVDGGEGVRPCIILVLIWGFIILQRFLLNS